MTIRFLVAISALLVCAGILLLRAVRSQPEQAMVESRELPRGQVASSATSPRERDTEHPPTEHAPAKHPTNNTIQRQATYQVPVEAKRLDADDDPSMQYIPGRAARFKIEQVADYIFPDEQDEKQKKPTSEQAQQALEVVDSVLSEYPEYERALALGATAACYLGDATKARQYISRMKTAAEGGRQKCKALGVEL